eukprot:562496_1
MMNTEQPPKPETFTMMNSNVNTEQEEPPKPEIVIQPPQTSPVPKPQEEPPKPEIVIQPPQTSPVPKPQEDYEPVGKCFGCIPIAFGVKFIVAVYGLLGLIFMMTSNANLPIHMIFIMGILPLVCAVLGAIGIRKSDPQAITRFQVVYMISVIVNAIARFFVEARDIATGKVVTVGANIQAGILMILLGLYVVYVFNQYKKSLK